MRDLCYEENSQKKFSQDLSSKSLKITSKFKTRKKKDFTFGKVWLTLSQKENDLNRRTTWIKSKEKCFKIVDMTLKKNSK